MSEDIQNRDDKQIERRNESQLLQNQKSLSESDKVTWRDVKIAFNELEKPTSIYKFFVPVAILGIIVSSILSVVYSATPFAPLIGIMAGIFTAIASVSTLPLYIGVTENLKNRTPKKKFEKFFGKSVFDKSVRLIFAERRLRETYKKTDLYVYSTYWENSDYKPDRAALPEGIKIWLAFEDVRAASNLSSEITKMTGKKVLFKLDSAVGQEYCAIALGLGFNAFTHELSKQELFKIVWGESPKNSEFYTDNLIIKGLTSVNGKALDLQKPPGGRDYAIIARIVKANHPEFVRFVVAGRTALGTAVAGYFLSDNWKALHQMYEMQDGKELEKNSCVFVVEHPTDGSDDSGKIVGYKFSA